MSANLALLAAIGTLFATGTFLLMERSLTRVLLGVVLLGNGVNLLVLHAGGQSGRPPIMEGEPTTEGMSDPLPQALILTAIVITFGVTAFVLAMIYRSWRLANADEVTDDVEDLRVGEAPEDADDSARPEDEEPTEFGEPVDDDSPAEARPPGGPRGQPR